MHPTRISPGFWIALLFVLAGLPFLQSAGLHYDASYELTAFYDCSHVAQQNHIFGLNAPVMIIPYLGAFKAWLYQPLLRYLDVTPFVLRLPTLLVGAGSVWIFFILLDRVSGRRAAIAGALLLATDSSFVLATSFDFGPVVFLHFLLLSGTLLLLLFDRTRSLSYLGVGFFCFGLGLWDKALFIWMLAGLGAAALVAFPSRLRELLSPVRVMVAATCLCVGASPLIYYNVISRGATLRAASSSDDVAPFPQKLLVLRKTLDGSVLFGFLTDESGSGIPQASSRRVDRISVAVNSAVGAVRTNWTAYAFVASLGLIPWLWFTGARRAVIFAVVYMAVCWALMLILPGTGAAMHHVILLWPFPPFLIGISGAQVSYRWGHRGAWALGLVLSLLLVRNVLLLNQYLARLATNGTAAIWTDASNPLFEYLEELNAKRLVIVDWGYSATLCLLSDGRLPLTDISFDLLSPAAHAENIGSLITDRQTLFVDYAAGFEVFPGVHERLASIAQKNGYSRQVVETVFDRNDRPRFEVVRYRPVQRAP